MPHRPTSSPEPAEIVAALHASAEAAEGQVVLLPGLPDSTMDGWEVPVPEAIRAVFREVGGFWIKDWSCDIADRFGIDQPGNDDRDGPGYRRSGEPGTFRVVHTNNAAETYYVDVDPETGEWGKVFSFWENADATLVAPSLPDWLLTLTEYVHAAAHDAEAGHFSDFTAAFTDWFFGEFAEASDDFPEDDPRALDRDEEVPRATVLGAVRARASGDPLLSAVAERLPGNACVADLRDTAYPTAILLSGHRDWPGGDAVYHRFHGGEVLGAIPLDV